MTIQQATEQATDQATDQTTLTAAEQAVINRRNANMRQATADQSLSLLDTLADFRLVFPSMSEVTEIVVSSGGLKSTGKETQNTTLLLYITMLGEEIFHALYDSTNISQADTINMTPAELNQKCARHALTIYRSLITVDKYAALIPATAKFTRTVQPTAVQPTAATK